jgi:hypothetical protein
MSIIPADNDKIITNKPISFVLSNDSCKAIFEVMFEIPDSSKVLVDKGIILNDIIMLPLFIDFNVALKIMPVKLKVFVWPRLNLIIP